jgi:DKNYY family
MKNKILLLLLFEFSNLFCQTIGKEKTLVAIINNNLKIENSFYKKSFFENEVFINPSYFIYQLKNKVVKVNVDTKSLKFTKYSNHFLLGKNKIYLRGKLIPIDTTGFRILTSSRSLLWKTSREIFLDSINITKDIDVLSYEIINSDNDYYGNYYFKDKNYIYYNHSKIIGSDPSSAVDNNIEIMHDKNFIYKDGEILKFNNEPLKFINNYLYKTSNLIVNDKLSKIDNIDINTIRALSSDYAIDKNNVYYKDTIYSKIKLSKVENIQDIKAWRQANSSFITDGIKVYGNYELPEDIDAKSFGMFSKSDIYYDKNGIYIIEYNDELKLREIKKIPFDYTNPVSEKNSSISVNNNFYIFYENQAFSYSGKVNKNQVKQFSLSNIELLKKKPELDFDLRKEDNYLKGWIYTKNKILSWDENQFNVDYKSFVAIGNYFRDKNHVYCTAENKKLNIIEDIDSKTFEQINHFYTDKNYVFFEKYKLFKNINFEILEHFGKTIAGCGYDHYFTSYFLVKNINGYYLILYNNIGVSMRILG